MCDSLCLCLRASPCDGTAALIAQNKTRKHEMKTERAGGRSTDLCVANRQMHGLLLARDHVEERCPGLVIPLREDVVRDAKLDVS